MIRLGLSISYGKLERMDYTLANSLGEPCVPAPNSINSSIIHWAISNLDCTEIIKSWKGRSHDAILIIFNVDTIHEYQRINFCKFCRGGLAHNFVPSTYHVPEDITQIRLEEYNVWFIGCHVFEFIPIYLNSEEKLISSFIEIKKLLSDQNM